jgi:DNA-binding transcriptional LysR family regulator
MERLDLRLVEYFVTVAEELHFARAAERLHIAQPSLSQQIRRLEQQLGVVLLDRSSRRVELTPAGEVLLRDGRKLLAAARRTAQAVRSAATPALTVGFYGSAAIALLPDTLRTFGERHPSFAVSVREVALGSLDDVLNGVVDVAFTRLSPGQSELEIEVMFSEPRVVALPSAHPLAQRSSLAFADLREEAFITNAVDQADGDRPPRWLSEQRRHRLPGRVAARATGVPEILTLVAAARGVCLVPSTVARHYPRDDVVYTPIVDADPAVVSLAWRPGGLSAAVSAFIDAARQVASKSGGPGPGLRQPGPARARLQRRRMS